MLTNFLTIFPKKQKSPLIYDRKRQSWRYSQVVSCIRMGNAFLAVLPYTVSYLTLSENSFFPILPYTVSYLTLSENAFLAVLPYTVSFLTLSENLVFAVLPYTVSYLTLSENAFFGGLSLHCKGRVIKQKEGRYVPLFPFSLPWGGIHRIYVFSVDLKKRYNDTINVYFSSF